MAFLVRAYKLTSTSEDIHRWQPLKGYPYEDISADSVSSLPTLAFTPKSEPCNQVQLLTSCVEKRTLQRTIDKNDIQHG